MKSLLIVIAIVCLAVTGSIVFAEDAKTWNGEVLDLVCYIGSGAKGEGHAGCAKGCAKGGQPMGLLTDDGSVLLLSIDRKNPAPYEALKELAGENASVTGKMSERDGMKVLVVSSSKGS